MRAFFALSLALVTGCGDNLGDGSDLGIADPSETDGVLDDGVVPRLVPEVCSARAWPEAIVDAKDSDLAVVEMPLGSAVLAVPRGGGDLRGFLLDGRGLVMGNPEGIKVRTGKFTGVTATRVDSRLVVGLTDGATSSVTVVRDDLLDYRELTTVASSFIGDTPVMKSRDQRVTLTGGANGMTLSAFDQAWAPMGDVELARSVPTSMTSAPYGNDAMVAWTTDAECHVMRVASNIHSMDTFPCHDARLATNYADRAGQLVFQGGDSIYMSDIRVSAHNELANQKLLVPTGFSPRITHDGTRYWVSYVNPHGDIVVGYLDGDNLVSTSIQGTRPLNGSYDLAVVNGAVWVYAIDAETGFNANRLCLVREGA